MNNPTEKWANDHYRKFTKRRTIYSTSLLIKEEIRGKRQIRK